MKRALLAPFILFCTLLFTTSAFAMKNEPDSFRGIPWGAVAPEKNFVEGNKWGLVKDVAVNNIIGDLYSRSEEVFIGKVKITSPIIYVFHDDYGFSAAVIEFKGPADYDLIRKACIDNWGQPDLDERGKNEKSGYDRINSLWSGEKMIILLNHEIDTPGKGTLLFMTNKYYEIQ